MVLARVSDDLGRSSAPGFGCLEGVFGGIRPEDCLGGGLFMLELVLQIYHVCWRLGFVGQFGLRRRILTPGAVVAHAHVKTPSGTVDISFD